MHHTSGHSLTLAPEQALNSGRASVVDLFGGINAPKAGLFDPADDEGVIGPTFSVSPDDTIVDVDVTDLLSPDLEDVFLMLENKGAEQYQGAEGDRFFTRETNDPPQLIITVT